MRLTPVATLGVLPSVVLVSFLYLYWRHHALAADFRAELYPQAKGLLASGVPFDSVGVTINGANRIFTVVATMLATPLTLLSPWTAGLVVTALLIAAAAATLAVLGVRDWRVYGVLALWTPVLSALQTGNLTLVLGLVAALAWRYRDHRFLPGLLVGLAFALKVFMWPLAVWLIATRRFPAALAAAGVAGLSILAILPFGNPVDYFRLANRTAAVFGRHAYSLYVLLGGGSGARIAWAALASLTLLAAVFADDRSSFTLALLGAILFSPIVWIHYFALLLVPLAIGRPRFGTLWLAPLAFWLVPFGYAARWQIAVALGTALLVVGALVASGRAVRVGAAPRLLARRPVS